MEAIWPSTAALRPSTSREGLVLGQDLDLDGLHQLRLLVSGRRQSRRRGGDLVSTVLGVRTRPLGGGRGPPPFGSGLLKRPHQRVGVAHHGPGVRPGVPGVLTVLRVEDRVEDAGIHAAGHVGGHDLAAQALLGIGRLPFGDLPGSGLLGSLDLCGLEVRLGLGRLGLLGRQLRASRSRSSPCSRCCSARASWTRARSSASWPMISSYSAFRLVPPPPSWTGRLGGHRHCCCRERPARPRPRQRLPEPPPIAVEPAPTCCTAPPLRGQTAHPCPRHVAR